MAFWDKFKKPEPEITISPFKKQTRSQMYRGGKGAYLNTTLHKNIKPPHCRVCGKVLHKENKSGLCERHLNEMASLRYKAKPGYQEHARKWREAYNLRKKLSSGGKVSRHRKPQGFTIFNDSVVRRLG